MYRNDEAPPPSFDGVGAASLVSRIWRSGPGGLVDRAGQFLAGTHTGLIREGGCLAESQLQGAQAVAQGCCVLGTNLGGGGGDQACQGGDELACFIEVFEIVGVLVGGQAALIMWMAAELMISMAGTSAISRSCSLTASTCSSVSSV